MRAANLSLLDLVGRLEDEDMKQAFVVFALAFTLTGVGCGRADLGDEDFEGLATEDLRGGAALATDVVGGSSARRVELGGDVPDPALFRRWCRGGNVYPITDCHGNQIGERCVGGRNDGEVHQLRPNPADCEGI